jgi:hypothetical protein
MHIYFYNLLVNMLLQMRLDTFVLYFWGLSHFSINKSQKKKKYKDKRENKEYMLSYHSNTSLLNILMHICKHSSKTSYIIYIE